MKKMYKFFISVTLVLFAGMLAYANNPGKLPKCEKFLSNKCEKSNLDFVSYLLENPTKCLTEECIHSPKTGMTQHPYLPKVRRNPHEYERRILYSFKPEALKGEACAMQRQPCVCQDVDHCDCKSKNTRFCKQTWRIEIGQFLVMKMPKFGGYFGQAYSQRDGGRAGERHFAPGSDNPSYHNYGYFGNMMTGEDEDPNHYLKLLQTMKGGFQGMSSAYGGDPKQYMYFQYLKTMMDEDNKDDDKFDYLKWMYTFQLLKQSQSSHYGQFPQHSQQSGQHHEEVRPEYYGQGGSQQYGGTTQQHQGQQQSGQIYHIDSDHVHGPGDHSQSYEHPQGHVVPPQVSNSAHYGSGPSMNPLVMMILLKQGSVGHSGMLQKMLPYLIGNKNMFGGLVNVEYLYVKVPDECTCDIHGSSRPKPKKPFFPGNPFGPHYPFKPGSPNFPFKPHSPHYPPTSNYGFNGYNPFSDIFKHPYYKYQYHSQGPSQYFPFNNILKYLQNKPSSKNSSKGKGKPKRPRKP